MFDTEAVKSGFGRAAGVYDEYALLQRHVRAHCIKLAQQHWLSHARILDAGSGTGAFAQETSWQTVELDLSYGMCATSAHKPSVVNADAQAMPFAAASFDGVFSSLMLQWVNDGEAAFQEISRVMKSGAHAVLSTLVSGTLSELKTAFSTIDAHAHISEFHEAHQLLAQAKTAGLSLVSARQMPLVEYYPDAVALMRALQVIGATNKESTRRKGLMTPQQFARMENAYEKQRTSQGLPATWQVLYLVLQKT